MSMLPADIHRRLEWAPDTIDVNGRAVQHPYRLGSVITLVGIATHVGRNQYICLAEVDGILCRVQVRIVSGT